ncbi:MAG TPA: hypothetical protein VFH39_03570 [Candidatus Saccharimonadales bacterium]|nr:hypothetical protein [Candidatus Saccharimonadales bacterium]
MSLHDYAQLFAILGLFLVALSAVTFFLPIKLRTGYTSLWMFEDLLNPTSRAKKWLLSDLKDPRVKVGGLLGLVIYGFVIGTGLLAIGGILWLIWYVVER